MSGSTLPATALQRSPSHHQRPSSLTQRPPSRFPPGGSCPSKVGPVCPLEGASVKYWRY